MPQHKVFRMFSLTYRTMQSSAFPKAQASKKTKKATTELDLSDNQASDDDIDKEEETRRENKFAPLLVFSNEEFIQIGFQEDKQTSRFCSSIWWISQLQ